MQLNDGEPNGDNIELDIFAYLRKIFNAVDIYASKLKERTGLNASQLSCLMVLDSEGALPLSKLSKKVSLSPSMITSIVDQLEKKEMVARQRSSSDRRIIQIELTDSGRQVVKTAPPSFQEQFMSRLSRLENGEKKKIQGILEKLLSIIASDVLIDSPLMGAENKLVEVAPSVLRTEEI